jgi:hypothetical protein
MKSKIMEKRNLEKGAIKCFLPLYNEEKGTSFVVKSHSDEPDFIICDAKKNFEMGVEIAHLYYDPKEAKMILGRSKNNTHGLMIFNKLIDELNQLLLNKSSDVKHYYYESDIILVVRVISPIFSSDAFEMYKKDIKVPISKFSEIWLLTRSPKSSGPWDTIQRIS